MHFQNFTTFMSFFKAIYCVINYSIHNQTRNVNIILIKLKNSVENKNISCCKYGFILSHTRFPFKNANFYQFFLLFLI